jgi:DnaJ-domain-containing protein 1
VDIFDKLNRIIDSFVDADTEPGAERFDPDFSDAWQELESFMRGGNYDGEPGGRTGAWSGSAGGRGGRGGIPPELERDFHNLEVAVGAPWNDVQRAYKRQLAQYHPDRFAAQPKKYATATEITKQLNYSYQRLKQFYAAGAHADGTS